jgi:DNA-binding XRE family transcriptional regulator
MMANQFKHALDDLGLTQTKTAQLLGLGRTTVTGYANGSPIPEPVAIVINMMLGGVVTPDQIEAVGR